MTVYKFKFDFDVGNLINSPCKECIDRKKFPKCIDQCKMIDKIRLLENLGADVKYFSADVTSLEQMKNIFEEVNKKTVLELLRVQEKVYFHFDLSHMTFQIRRCINSSC